MSVKISSLNTASTINSGDTIGVAGNNPFYFSDWGGGWYMEDSTWIRSYASKSLWMANGILGSQGGLSVGYGGTSPSSGGAIIAGNVGIGTTSPSTLLTVEDQSNSRVASFKGAGGAAYSTFNIMTLGGNGNGYWRASAIGANIKMVSNQPAINVTGFSASSIVFGSDSNQGRIGFFTTSSNTGDAILSESMRIDTSGNIGINTTAPQKILDVVSGANNFVTVGADGLGVGQWAGIHFGYRENNALYRKSAIVFERTDNAGGGANAAGKIYILNGPGSGAGSATLADAKLTIDEYGKVGIGTTTPGYTLDVNGTARIQGQLAVNHSLSGNYGAIIYNTSATGEGLVVRGGSTASHTSFAVQPYDGSVSLFSVVASGAATFSSSVTATIVTAPNINVSANNGMYDAGTNSLGFQTNGAVRMFVSSAGNVGIGTTSPASILETIGQVTINEVTTGAGIGKLQLKGAKSDVNGFNLTFDNSLSIASVNLYYNGALTFGNANTEKMRIAPTSGNLLIGTTTDAGYKLYVNGKGLFDGVVNSYATMDNLARRINSPEGASYVTTTSSVTGAIKIKLPVARNNSSTMMMFRVKIYQYNTGNCHEFQIAGYNYVSGNWYNPSVTDLTDNGSNFNVRFGTDATSDCIWIGETNSGWVYPQVFVTDFQAGYGGDGISWATGWAISFETSFDTVEQTRLASQVITSRSIGAQSVNYAVSAGTAGALSSMNISQFTNNSGYITSSSLSGYLPLTGGTLTGDVTTSGWFINSTDFYGIKNSSNGSSFWSSYGGWNLQSSATDNISLVFNTSPSSGATLEQFRIGWSNAIGIYLQNDQGADASIVAYQGAGYGGYLTGTWNITNNLNITGDVLQLNDSAIYDTAAITYRSALAASPSADIWFSGMAVDITSSFYYIRFTDTSFEQARFRVYENGRTYIYGDILATNSFRTYTSSYLRLSGTTGANDWLVKQSDSAGYSIIKNTDTLYSIGTTGTHSFYSTQNLLATFTNSGSTFGVTQGNYNRAYFHVTGAVGATHAMFGSTYPLLFGSNYPTVYYNMYYSSGWKIASGTSVYGGATVYDPVNGIFYWYLTGTAASTDGTVAPAIQFRIDRNGQVSIGTTASTSDKFYVSGGSVYLGGNTRVSGTLSASSLLVANGPVYCNTATVSGFGTLTTTNPSDIRLKEDIETLKYGLKEVMALKPVTYKWKNPQTNGKRYTGLIAQDVQEIMPDYVSNTSEDDDYLGLDSYAINIVLINAIKELKAEIEILKNK